MNETNEPMQEAVLMPRALYEQTREALKDMIKVAEVGLRLAGNCEEVITIRLKKSKDVLAAMEATHNER